MQLSWQFGCPPLLLILLNVILNDALRGRNISEKTVTVRLSV